MTERTQSNASRKISVELESPPAKSFPDATRDQDTQDHVTQGLGVLTAVVFLVGEMAGSGVLALPNALENAGWIGIVIIVACAAISAYTGQILGRCWTIVQDRYPSLRGHVRYPYPAMGYITYGTIGRLVVSFSINFTMFGASVVYLLLASQNVQDIVKHLFKFNWSFCYWMLVVVCILLPISWLGTPKDFWPIAVGAMAATSIACVILVANMTVDIPDNPRVIHSDVTLLSFAQAFGTICFAFGGHPMFPTFQSDMREPSKFPRVCYFGFLALAVMYLPVATSGYFVYGKSVKANLLQSISPGAMRMIAEILVTGHLFCGFIIIINPVCQEIEELLKIEKHFNWKRAVVRSLMCLLVAFVAISIPHFGTILSLIGGSTTTLLAFIAPPLIYLKLAATDGPWKSFTVPLFEKVANVEIMVVGLVAGVAATYSAILSLASPDAFTPPCYINITAASGS
ncbi:hypothetical protein C0Q70_10741 [Pomacea canaliculata]|uniref:Amino acid transporter transmembrane domain-containing protein n=1 Tax=Pomacea canaliculata TaxID=400727 RepID=A0A2T7P419_POMCA|nr:amino acid transporter AVT1H-like isoform X2 [Pomacea canaliculata]PVD28156.1 hypothetical protein C0Q70_10741 [Pomacea canaliculata]